MSAAILSYFLFETRIDVNLSYVALIHDLFSSTGTCHQIQSTIDDGVTLKPESADSSAYNEWLTYFDAKDPAKYWNVRFFNITNVDDVALQKVSSRGAPSLAWYPCCTDRTLV